MATIKSVISGLLLRVSNAWEGFWFSRNREFMRSLDASDERARAGEGGTIDDLDRELDSHGHRPVAFP